MKTRNGFVSNSSSTSFCIYGVCIEPPASEEHIEKIEAFAEENGLDCIMSQGDECFVGEKLSTMDDNETFGEFKSKVKNKIEGNLNIDNMSDFGIYQDSWFDG